MMAKAAAAKKGRPRKKRKGRPARSDPPLPVLLRRPPPPPFPSPEPTRRSLRSRRRRRPIHDFHDFTDAEGEEEEEERGRRKLKLVLKLPNITTSRRDERQSDSPALASRSRSIPSSGHVSSSSSSASSSSYVDDDEEEEEEGGETIKPPKKRRIEGCDDGVCSDGYGDQEREGKNVLRRCKGSISGLSSNSFAGTPLPERKTLEAILDKLQKKDTYGVFAEPVDPEELPDYHDVIEHPMDFGTVRKKLASKAYRCFEQFEDDVFLICSNAMQYNAPDTIYFRQARSIQDMARQKFRKLRVDGKCAETAGKSEEKITFNSMEKKPIMKSLSRTAQEPLGSDISSAATLASTGDANTGLSMAQANGGEAPIIINGIADGSSSLGESKSEKADELSARSSPAKLGQKPFVVDENRRATYNMSEQQSVIETDLMFDVFEGETRQLVAVGVHAEYSYARSLARFSASLGPIAWEIASKSIEKVLPAGVKFGPGWVGEFEPLRTPVLSLENHNQRQLGLNSNIQFKLISEKDKVAKDRLQATQNRVPKDVRLALKGQVTTGRSNKASNLVKERDYHQRTAKVKGFSGVSVETQRSGASGIPQPRKDKATVNSAESYTSVTEHARPWHSTSVSSIPVETPLHRLDNQSEAVNSRSPGIISWDRNNGQPGHQKQQEAVASQSRNEVLRTELQGLSNGKATRNPRNNISGGTLGFISKPQPGAAGNFLAHSNLEQGINNHSRLIGLSGQKFNQPNISDIAIDAPKPLSPGVIPSGRVNTSAAATAAARAWMSIGASAECKAVAGTGLPNNQPRSASFQNFAWKTPNSPSRIHEDSNARHVPQLFQQPSHVVSEESKFHDKELVIFPQLIRTDLSRFQGQSPWENLIPQTQQKQSKEMRPPDLNIGFQLPGSPVHQSSGILKDSQQPDLALQL